MSDSDDESVADSNGFEGEGGPGHSSDMDDNVRGREGSGGEADSAGEGVADIDEGEIGGIEGDFADDSGAEMAGGVGHAQMQMR